MSRKITVYTTGSGVGKVIETDTVNWGQLKTELGKNGVSYNNMKAVVGKTKTNLEHPEAALPDEDFILFLFPEKTRSGATYTATQIANMPYKELREVLKGLSTEDEASFKAHFNGDGKNYTVKSTDTLKALLASYKSKPAAKSSKIADVVSSISKSKAVAKPNAVVTTKSDKPVRIKRETIEEEAPKGNVIPSFKNDDEKTNFIIDLINGMTSPTSEQKDKAISAIAVLKAGSEVKGNKSSSFTTIDNDSLRREAEQIRRNISGVQ